MKLVKKSGKYRAPESSYDDLAAELDKPNPNVKKINDILDKLDLRFEKKGLDELGLKTFKFLHTKYSQSWLFANNTQNQILSRLNDFIYIYS